MKAIIIEDEDFAALRLEKLINDCDPSIEIVGKLQSVKESVKWLNTNQHPDLIFLDIQLDDDLSFAIFDQVQVQSQIIFTTAFDEYAIKAFKLKSIDYLLKPIDKDDLKRAIEKFKNWNQPQKQFIDANELRQLLQPQAENFRERFSVTVGEKLRSVEVADIAYFFSTSGITFIVAHSGKQFSIDYSLDQLTQMLNPKMFFRVNRQYLVKLKGIANVHVFPKSRLKLELNPPAQEEIFVSLEKVVAFKTWLDGE